MIGQWCETCGEMTLPRESDNRCLWCGEVLSEPSDANIRNPETRRGIGAGTGLAAATAAGPGRDGNQATSGERLGSLSTPYQASHPWRARRAARLGK